MRLLRPRFAAPLGFIAALLAFLPCLANGFVAYDDLGYVVDNPVVRAGLSLELVRYAFTTFAQDNWHPLTWLSLGLDATLFGAGPAGFHATNVVLHALNAALVVVVVAKLTGDDVVALAAAALFALHPLRVESVAWIAERKDVLCAAFFLVTLLAWLNDRKLLAFLALALGLLAKPMLVTAPFVLVVVDWAWQRRPARAA